MENWNNHQSKKSTNISSKILLAVLIIGFFAYYTGALKLDLDSMDLEKIKEKLNLTKEGLNLPTKENNHPPSLDNYKEIDIIIRPSCSLMEMGAKSQGIGKEEVKQAECTFRCGEENSDYSHYECIKDKLHCYCKI